MKRHLPAPNLLALLALAALGAFGLAACAHVEPSITQQTKIYRDAPVEKSKLAVAVKPRTRLTDAPKALMYPFWIAQKMENHLLVGRELARQVHQAWTGDEVFETLAFDPQLVYRGPEQAVSIARAAGADLVIVGIVPYIYTGGTQDSTSVSLQIRIYETATGNLLLSMEQSARVNVKLPQDWVLFTIETRLSDSPLSQALAGIAKDMAVPLKSWLPPTDEELGFADNAQAMSRGLLASGSPLAGPDDDGSDGSRGLTAALLGSGNGAGAKGGRKAAGTNSVKLKVEFDVDSARIREGSFGLLNELGAALKSSALSGKRVVLSGHADSSAGAAHNQKLSERRAEAVKAYLVERCGIEPRLLRTEGFGEMRPLVPNTTPANKQRNRRVEVRLDV